MRPGAGIGGAGEWPRARGGAVSRETRRSPGAQGWRVVGAGALASAAAAVSSVSVLSDASSPSLAWCGPAAGALGAGARGIPELGEAAGGGQSRRPHSGEGPKGWGCGVRWARRLLSPPLSAGFRGPWLRPAVSGAPWTIVGTGHVTATALAVIPAHEGTGTPGDAGEICPWFRLASLNSQGWWPGAGGWRPRLRRGSGRVLGSLRLRGCGRGLGRSPSSRREPWGQMCGPDVASRLEDHRHGRGPCLL